MISEEKRYQVAKLFCDRFEGREAEMDCYPIAYGEIPLIATQLDVSKQEVAKALMQLLDEMAQ